MRAVASRSVGAPRAWHRDSCSETLVDDLLDAILPARCPGCGRRGALVCDRVPRPRSRRAPPRAPPPPVEWWTACFAYEGVARELVAAGEVPQRAAVPRARRARARGVRSPPRPRRSTSSRGRPRARHASGRTASITASSSPARSRALVGVRAARLPACARPGPPQTGSTRTPGASGPHLRARSAASRARRSSSSTTSPPPGERSRPPARALRRRGAAACSRGDDRPDAEPGRASRSALRILRLLRPALGHPNSNREHVDVVVFGKHVEVDPALRAVTLEKLERIGKFAERRPPHRRRLRDAPDPPRRRLVHVRDPRAPHPPSGEGHRGGGRARDGARPRAREGRAPDAPPARAAGRGAGTARVGRDASASMSP